MYSNNYNDFSNQIPILSQERISGTYSLTLVKTSVALIGQAQEEKHLY
jgi:hypothetical protein